MLSHSTGKAPPSFIIVSWDPCRPHSDVRVHVLRGFFSSTSSPLPYLWDSVPIYLETLGKGSKKLDFDGQTDKSGHAAVWNGGCEGHSHRTLGVAHLVGRMRSQKDCLLLRLSILLQDNRLASIGLFPYL